MRKSELTREQWRDKLKREQSDLRKLIEKRDACNSVPEYADLLIQIKDVEEEIEHIQDKLDPNGIRHTLQSLKGTCPHCDFSFVVYGHNYVRCAGCGRSPNPTRRVRGND